MGNSENEPAAQIHLRQDMDAETRAFLTQQLHDLQSHMFESGSLNFEVDTAAENGKNRQTVKLLFRTVGGSILEASGNSESFVEACLLAKSEMITKLQRSGVFSEELELRNLLINHTKLSPYLH